MKPSINKLPDFITCKCELTQLEFAEGTPGESRIPTFKMVANTGGPMKLQWWDFPVVVDLSRVKIPTNSVPIRMNHDPDRGVGHTTECFTDGKKMICSGMISRDTEEAREIISSSQKGFPWQASIGLSIMPGGVDRIESNMVVEINGRKLKGPINVVRDSELSEISFVDLGADRRTSATVVAQSGGNEMKNVSVVSGNDSVVRDSLETPPVQTPAENKSVIAGDSTGEDVPVSLPAGGVTPVQVVDADAVMKESRRIAATETSRVASIRKLCAGNHPDIEAKAIVDGWTMDKVELEVLRAARPKVQAAAIHLSDAPVTAQVLEAACYQTSHMSGLEKMFSEEILEASNRRYRSRLGLQEMILEAAYANGFTGRSFKSSPRECLRYAFGRSDIEASGVSTINIGGILSNIANKFLLEGFFAVEMVWRQMSAVRNVSDFKTVTSYRLIGKDQYELIAPGGTFKHGDLAEETYTNKADTYGLMLNVDRRDIINDDLGAITTVPRKLGRGSGLKINDIFWTIWLANGGSFFGSGNANISTGALGIAGLTAAELVFLDQVDGDGKPIGILPKFILVPTAHSATAAALFRSTELRDTTAATKYPVANPHAGKFQVLTSRYLGNAAFPGYSAVKYYLLADPNDLPVVEVAFLNGQESPTIETSDADFNQLGIQMRGFHDFGVALQDPKGGVQSSGV